MSATQTGGANDDPPPGMVGNAVSRAKPRQCGKGFEGVGFRGRCCIVKGGVVT